MLKLERRLEPSRAVAWASPLLALTLTLAVGFALFVALGKDPLRGLALFFYEPLKNERALAELSIKACPLLLIALGLSLCFRANVWNIGAEGQFILGTLGATGVAIRATPTTPPGFVIGVLVAGFIEGTISQIHPPKLSVVFKISFALMVGSGVYAYLWSGALRRLSRVLSVADRLVTASR